MMDETPIRMNYVYGFCFIVSFPEKAFCTKFKNEGGSESLINKQKTNVYPQNTNQMFILAKLNFHE